MNNQFPLDLKEYFNMRWDNNKLHHSKYDVFEGSLSDFVWHLELPFWATSPPNNIFDLKPLDVINFSDKFKMNYERILKADISFPIDTFYISNKLVILDGLHRLSKKYIQNDLKVKYRIVDKKDIIFLED